MNLTISLQQDKPLYEQIENQIIQMIVAGHLKPGEKLPSIRTCAKELSVGIITVKRAYDNLVNQNILMSKEAKGYYVAEVNQHTVKKQMIQTLKKELAHMMHQAYAQGVTKMEFSKILEELADESKH